MDDAIYVKKAEDVKGANNWINSRYGKKLSEHKLKNRALKVAQIQARKHSCIIKVECPDGHYKKMNGGKVCMPCKKGKKNYTKKYYKKKKMKGLFDMTNIKT